MEKQDLEQIKIYLRKYITMEDIQYLLEKDFFYYPRAFLLVDFSSPSTVELGVLFFCKEKKFDSE